MFAAVCILDNSIDNNSDHVGQSAQPMETNVNALRAHIRRVLAKIKAADEVHLA